MGAPWTIQFGALHDKRLSETLQLDGGLRAEAADHFQLDAQAITRLLVRGLIGDVGAQSARHKLVKSIRKELKA